MEKLILRSLQLLYGLLLIISSAHCGVFRIQALDTKTEYARQKVDRKALFPDAYKA